MELYVGDIPVTAHRSMEDAVDSILSNSQREVAPGFAIAINPEKVMKARSDAQVMATLNSATFRYADGIGVVWMLRQKGAPWASRIPGCELWIHLMRRAAELKQPVFLVGAAPDVLETVREKLNTDFGSHLVGSQDGYFASTQQDDVIRRIKDSSAKIVSVAMGSPRQELFIAECRKQYPDAFYMGVGGTYDVFVGHVQRAPEWACRMNIEWLYRLLSNPSRMSRQLVLIHYLALGLLRRL